MKKAGVIALCIVICTAALFWITLETNPEIATRLGYASGPGKSVEVIPDAPNAMVPSIVYEDNLYRTTGKQIPAEVDESAIVGRISSVVPLSQLPSKEGESNFGEVGDPYAITSDGLLVVMNNEWVLFKVSENNSVGKKTETIQFHDKIINKSELSQETIEWLEWYNQLNETEQLSISYIPNDLYEICGFDDMEDVAAVETVQEN